MTEQLHTGKRQLEKLLVPLVTAADKTLQLSSTTRQRTVIRLDAGGGSDANFKHLLADGYKVLGKMHNGLRCRRLAGLVDEWVQDPTNPQRQFGWPSQPVAFEQETRQLVIRRLKPKKQQRKGKPPWAYSVLLTNLPDAALAQLAGFPSKDNISSDSMFLLSAAYDKRGGGVETAFREDKQALGMSKRNKRSFNAQQMLMLLTQMAHNLLVWARRVLRRYYPPLRTVGLLRFVRDFLRLPARFQLTATGQLVAVLFGRTHPAASIWCSLIGTVPNFNHLSACLYKI